ncbi:DUF5615 family PIN-like protein (plasmid) [Gemmobacter fulvus]|uniref:DUF5615 family PIN-like protein n=1 Tax=Gemmobacter fulvus TaxID=2840474 RepID=A0A975PBB6_9RHOB|nr:DUF5615 family PIN-like protein [Gemmobacter fulvus]MBT9248158.1 DUF5615 family PIN-like protein [Gemmobacter fulvus]QWK92832.1 DUF5615 family PIN-like protein [Gemmobacter fulvus]
MKFLIDECLALDLAQVAVEAGHLESAHLTHRGMTGWKDHMLMERILAEDWTLVTRNSDDFRPPEGSNSNAPCYLGIELHAGLVCLNLPNGALRGDHIDFFRAALDDLGEDGDLTNQILEVWLVEVQDFLEVERYDFPANHALFDAANPQAADEEDAPPPAA